MQSLYDDIVTALREADLSLSVDVREPNDERPKSYPMVVVHEIVNIPESHATVTGEGRTVVGYQFDIDTTKCSDGDTVLSAYRAGRVIAAEIDELLDGEFKLTRSLLRQGDSPAADVVRHTLRCGAVVESSGYSYRQ